MAAVPGNRRYLCSVLLGALVILLSRNTSAGEEAWVAALRQMPLINSVAVLNRTNCAQVVLGSFQSNATAKALIFMPGATDELYFFKRVKVAVTNVQPSVWDAMEALTNQSPLRLAFQSPFVLLYSGEDVLPLDYTIKHERTQKKLMRAKPLAHVESLDRDWSHLLRLIKNQVPAVLIPYEGTIGSWHFYRHTFAGWNLTPWEVLEAAAYAGKTRFTVVRNGVVFEVDPRMGELPDLNRSPRAVTGIFPGKIF